MIILLTLQKNKEKKKTKEESADPNEQYINHHFATLVVTESQQVPNTATRQKHLPGTFPNKSPQLKPAQVCQAS